MSTVAVVDGYSTGGTLGRMLAERGVTCVHVRSSAIVGEYFQKSFRVGDFVADLGFRADPAELSWQLRAYGVDKVVAGTESGVILADTLNHLLGTPGNDIATLSARRDKAAMAETVRAAGLAAPRGRTFDNADAAADWYATAIGDAAVVVKPVDSAGTDNVHFCHHVDQVRAACARILGGANLYGSPNRHVLVQELVVGTEYYVNSVSAAGVHRIAEIWRYTKRPGPTESPIYDFEVPVDPASDEAEPLRVFVGAVLDALGVRSSAAHTEIMVTDGGPVLIETGARLGGATLPHVVEKFSGVSQAALLAAALHEPHSLVTFDDRAPRWTVAVRNVALVNPVPVAKQSGEWLSRISELPTVVAVSGSPSPGAELPMTVDLISSPGFVYLASDDPREVERDYHALRELEQRRCYGK